MNKSFRDSLAHNSYFYDTVGGSCVYLKNKKEFLREKRLLNLDILFNYHDLIDTLFPGILKIPNELSVAQLLLDIMDKEMVKDVKLWEIRERFALNQNLTYWVLVCRVKQAICHANLE